MRLYIQVNNPMYNLEQETRNSRVKWECVDNKIEIMMERKYNKMKCDKIASLNAPIDLYSSSNYQYIFFVQKSQFC